MISRKKKCRIALAMQPKYYVTSDESKRLFLETWNNNNARKSNVLIYYTISF
jgi:hypothetical protein